MMRKSAEGHGTRVGLVAGCLLFLALGTGHSAAQEKQIILLQDSDLQARQDQQWSKNFAEYVLGILHTQFTTEQWDECDELEVSSVRIRRWLKEQIALMEEGKSDLRPTPGAGTDAGPEAKLSSAWDTWSDDKTVGSVLLIIDHNGQYTNFYSRKYGINPGDVWSAQPGHNDLRPMSEQSRILTLTYLLRHMGSDTHLIVQSKLHQSIGDDMPDHIVDIRDEIKRVKCQDTLDID